jgi:hypothetical protein
MTNSAANTARYRANHPDRVKATLKANRAKNKPRTAAYNKAYRSSFKGWISNTWSRLNARTVNGTHPNYNAFKHYLEGGTRLDMTRQEFQTFCEENRDKIETMLGESNLRKRPSIDRIDKGHYNLDNIQILSVGENARKH